MKSKYLWLFLATLFVFLLLPNKVAAGVATYRGGYYTKLCGDSTDYGNGSGEGSYTGVTGSYNANSGCSYSCDPTNGTCSGPYVYRFVCDGDQINCGSGSPGLLQNINYMYTANTDPGCNKTVQLDAFGGNCYDAFGKWICGKPGGFMTWYTGACTCDYNQVNMSVSANHYKGGPITYTLTNSNGEGSVNQTDNWGGGASCPTGGLNFSSSTLGTKDCTAVNTVGSYIWTHNWTHCPFDDTDPAHCTFCQKQLTYGITPTCSVSLSSSSVATGQNVTATVSGNGSNKIQLWLEKQDSTAITSGVPVGPSVYSGRYYYNLLCYGSSCASSSNSTTLTLPNGNYYFHCDAGSELGVPKQCSGNPNCTYWGGSISCTDWGKCSTTDHASFSVACPSGSCQTSASSCTSNYCSTSCNATGLYTSQTDRCKVIPAPTVSPTTCTTTPTYTESINWTNLGEASYIYISTDPNFLSGTGPVIYKLFNSGITSVTDAPVGFTSLANGNISAFQAGTTYYAKLSNLSGSLFSDSVSFSRSQCVSPFGLSLQITNKVPAPSAPSNLKISGLQVDQNGVGWYNPMVITLGANKGTGDISTYYVAFYNSSTTLSSSIVDTSATPIPVAALRNLVANDYFVLKYTSAGTGAWHVWNPNSSTWSDITGVTGGQTICSASGCATSTYYTAVSGDSASRPANFSQARTWTIYFDEDFGSKTLKTAVSVVDSNGLSDFNGNITPSY